MRWALLLLLPILAAGCRSDIQEVRVDLTKVARLMRAYGAARARTPTPPEARELSPERVNDLGVMLERRGLLQKAEEHYRLAVERKPDFARAWVNLGNVLRQQGRGDEALDSYRRAMKEDPTLFEAVNNFADLCAEMGKRLDEAIALLRPALDAHPPEEGIGRDTLGTLLLRAERNEDAVEAFRTALGLANPTQTALTRAILRHLAEASRALGNEDEARSAELRAAALE
ncbi:MAG: tetratricopeptide repeat protein [Armatimonadota bacterium]|nr:MAG: tetratricopeptide repeat protein [Armatimonadota bacterium]